MWITKLNKSLQKWSENKIFGHVTFWQHFSDQAAEEPASWKSVLLRHFMFTFYHPFSNPLWLLSWRGFLFLWPFCWYCALFPGTTTLYNELWFCNGENCLWLMPEVIHTTRRTGRRGKRGNLVSLVWILCQCFTLCLNIFMQFLDCCITIEFNCIHPLGELIKLYCYMLVFPPFVNIS